MSRKNGWRKDNSWNCEKHAENMKDILSDKTSWLATRTTCSCGHLCSACLFLTTKEKIRLKYFITVEKKIIINNNNNKFFVMYLLDELFHLSWPQFYLGKHNAIWVHWCQWHMPHVLSNQWTEWKSCYTVQSTNHMMVQVTKLYQCSILSTIADTNLL